MRLGHNLKLLSVFAWWPLGLTGGGCTDPGDRVDGPGPTKITFNKPGKSSPVEEGEIVYERYCIGCHGPAGDGNGEAARFLHPRPRNFKEANFKYSSTPFGELPTDDDLRRTIRKGLRGTAMPAFDLLPDRSVGAVIAYIKTFSPKWEENGPGTPVQFATDPYRTRPDAGEAVRRGEAVYHGFAECWICHPAYVSSERINEHRAAFGGQPRSSFRPDLAQPVPKPDADGQLLFPRDFLRDFVRGGTDVKDLHRAIALGLAGTAMPSWMSAMHHPGHEPGEPPLVRPSDLWAIAYYVKDLIRRRPSLLKEGGFVVRDRRRKIVQKGKLPASASQPAARPDEEQSSDTETR